MSLLGIDLEETKLSIAVLDSRGETLHKEIIRLEGREGKQVGALITYVIGVVLKTERFADDPVLSIGICVPGIIRSDGTIYAPNIKGWEDYPLMEEVRSIAGGTPVIIESDRICAMQGERWKGIAKASMNVIFLSVGPEIGAGIIADGKVLRGASNISGAIGWMALNKPYIKQFAANGNFEYYASEKGIAKLAQNILKESGNYTGQLRNKLPEDITSTDVFKAFENDDEIALHVMGICIEYWGMAVANLVSLFNPSKIIIGGSVFGPAVQLIPEIRVEATKWAHPVSMKEVTIQPSQLGNDACVYGAAFLALQLLNPSK